MTGKTHRTGGMLCSVIGFILLKSNGLLIADVNLGLQWLIMYPFTYWGSFASDFDHNWMSCPFHDYTSWFINKLLHLTSKPVRRLDKKLTDKQKEESTRYKVLSFFNAKHRSWQTHSDLTIILILGLLYGVINGKFSLGIADTAILTLVIMGVGMGVLTHLLLDILTPDGIWLVSMVLLNKLFKAMNIKIKLPEKLHLVPNVKFFATGGMWESWVQKLLNILTWLSIIYIIYNTFEPYIQDVIPYTIKLG